MKKFWAVLCILLISALFFGCGSKEEVSSDNNYMQIGNPWKDYESLSQAEDAAGIKLDIPETIEGYTATVFRVMNDELLEVRYTDGESEVTVRKQAGEGQDISGDYTTYPGVKGMDLDGGSVKERTDGTVSSTIISFGGYSWSVYSPAEIAEAYINAIIDDK